MRRAAAASETSEVLSGDAVLIANGCASKPARGLMLPLFVLRPVPEVGA